MHTCARARTRSTRRLSATRYRKWAHAGSTNIIGHKSDRFGERARLSLEAFSRKRSHWKFIDEVRNSTVAAHKSKRGWYWSSSRSWHSSCLLFFDAQKVELLRQGIPFSWRLSWPGLSDSEQHSVALSSLLKKPAHRTLNQRTTSLWRPNFFFLTEK